MTVSCLYPVERGENVMKGAPTIDTNGGQCHIPQHYFTYKHDIDSIRTILCDIFISENVLLFANKDTQGMYLQVGIVGQENYQTQEEHYPAKIVYGRRWRIDADTPTSEIIQTTMLAIQKVFEHEVRELLTIQLSDKNVKSAPLTSHQDIRYLAKSASTFKTENSTACLNQHELEQAVKCRLRKIRFAGHQILLEQYLNIDSRRVVLDLRLTPCTNSTDLLPEAFCKEKLSVLVSKGATNNMMFSILDELIAISNRHVEEHFSFKGFQRFSRVYSPEWLAEKSLENRQYKKHMRNAQFRETFESLNYDTDKLRTPELGSDALAKINATKLAKYLYLEGHVPKGLNTVSEKQA
jgi:hypothetical protein